MFRDYIHVTDLAEIHIKGLNYLQKNKKFYFKFWLWKNFIFVKYFQKFNFFEYSKRRPKAI